jgi:endonuclease/exonuclease/phosphatase family metal-dependent hydrolase
VEIVVAVQNVGQDGASWPLMAEALAGVEPDLVLIQEAGRAWAADGARRLVRAEQDLDMDGILTPSQSGLGPALLYRRTLGRRTYENSDFGRERTEHGFTTVGWDLPCLPAILTAGSVHLTPYDAGAARAEANFVASRVHRAGGGYAILGGDINYAPQNEVEPDVSQMRPYNRGSRLLPSAAGQPPRADTQVADKLADNGFVDVAQHLYGKTREEALLAPTAGGMRIDQIWVSGALAPCITGYGLLKHGASDHHGAWARLDLSLAATDNVWEYA